MKLLRLIVAVTLIALAGCGNGSLQPFIHQLVTYCADLNKNVAREQGSPEGLTNEEMAAELNGLVVKAEALAADNQRLADSQQFNTFTANMKAAAGEFEKAHDAQTAGNKTETEAAVGQAMQRLGEAEKAARELGMPPLKDCEAWLRTASPNG
jgi:hypothetical protein